MIVPTNTPKRRIAGLSIIETMVGMMIGGTAMAVMCAATFYSGRSFAALSNYVDLDADSRNALDTLTREVRQANYLVAGTTNRLEFNDHDGQPLVYEYVPSGKLLLRSKGGQNTVLLRECDELTFSMFQRNPVGGTYDQYPSATATNAKVVQVTWTCSRKILGNTANTESVQSAKIVIRKQ